MGNGKGIALEFPLLGKLHYVHIYYGNKKLRKRRDIYALYMHGEVIVPILLDTGMEEVICFGVSTTFATRFISFHNK
jgi:hypothetical protein